MSDNSGVKLGGGYAWWVWILALTFVVFLFSVQTGYAIVSGGIQGEVGLSATQVATIAATYTWVFALCQFYGGALLDALGARKVLPVSIALVTLGVFIFAKAQTFEMLVLGQAVLAMGSCTGFVGAGYIGGQWFGMAKFSFMFGLVQVGAAATSAFSQNLIGVALTAMTWRELFMYVGFFGVALFVLGAIFIKNPAPVVSHSGGGGPIKFFTKVTGTLVDTAKSVHIWVASVWGALTFGALLSLGVVWAPGLLAARGADPETAILGASLLWMGLAVGSAVVPWWSDKIGKRKPPIILGSLVQMACFIYLVYFIGEGTGVDLLICFLFGFANSSHMLAFSTAADVVKPERIGTSAAIVNGIMFIFGGLLISRPGIRVDRAVELGIERGTMDIVQYAALPLIVALALAVVLSLAMRETYPGAENNNS